MDFAKRAHNHGYRIDPIVRSLMDTDFYKLLMLQFIWKKYYHTNVSFAMNNRTKSVKLMDFVDKNELCAQLNYVKNLKFTESELIWLRGQTFYGQSGLFEEGFIDYLRNFSLSDYILMPEKNEDGSFTGQYDLQFHGSWRETTLWEIYSLSIVNEMRYRHIMKSMSRSELDIMYARAKVKLHNKLLALTDLKDLNLSDFGTRRRHSFLWQEYAINMAKEVLGSNFSGTSNAYLAMKHNLEAKGTNAHELPMVISALANNDDELIDAQYKVLRQWQNVYRGGLLVMLPDTYGTTQFLDGISPIMANTWTGARPDSKPAVEAGEELIKFWERNDPANVKDKLIIFSDGMDVYLPGQDKTGPDIPSIHHHFKGKVRVGFGWGTMLTNDFRKTHPTTPDAMAPLSLVCKASTANNRPCVKLSDNYEKATGPKEEVDRYKKVFGARGIGSSPLIV